MIKKLGLSLMLLGSTSLYSAGKLEKMEHEIELLKGHITIMKSAKDWKSEADKFLFKHDIAVDQAKLLKKVLTREIYIYLAKQGIKRDIHSVEKIVESSFNYSWVFVDLGVNHPDRLRRLLEWCYAEGNFKVNLTCSWKKGQYIRSLDFTITKNTSDDGPWQINRDNFEYVVKSIEKLKKDKIIGKNIKTPKRYLDFYNIELNCIARCLIDTDRKNLGWEWKHHLKRNEHFVKFLTEIFYSLHDEGVYDYDLMYKYYNLKPIKAYSHENNSN